MRIRFSLLPPDVRNIVVAQQTVQIAVKNGSRKVFFREGHLGKKVNSCNLQSRRREKVRVEAPRQPNDTAKAIRANSE